MLIGSKLPKKYWDEAILTAAYTIARSPASSLKKRTPYQALFKHHIDSTIMQPFGCNAYTYISHDKRNGKLSKKGRKCVFFGYQPGKKAYQLLDLKSRKVITSRHVVFNKGNGGEHPPDLLPGMEPTEEQWESFLGSLLQRRPVRTDDGGPPVERPPGRAPPGLGSDSDSDDHSNNKGAVGGQWERAPPPVSNHPCAPLNTPHSTPSTRSSASPPPSNRKPPCGTLTTPSRIPRHPDKTPGPPAPPVPPVQPPFQQPAMPTPCAPRRGTATRPAKKVAGTRHSARERVPAD
jgi:hypothetical protein